MMTGGDNFCKNAATNIAAISPRFGGSWRDSAIAKRNNGLRAIPAIDILGGKCARLRRGAYESAEFFGDNPAEMARRFFALGARRLHLIDLDAAKSGGDENAAAVAAVIAAAAEFGATVQTGGGLRTMQDIRRVLDAGAAFAIVGTAAIRDATFREEAFAAFPEKIMLAADARNGHIAVAGWCEDAGMQVGELLDAIRANPPAAVIFTDIGRDGMLGGVNVDATAEVARLSPCPVIASGGARDEDDFRALAAHPNIAGAVVGRAAYNNPQMLKQILQKYG